MPESDDDLMFEHLLPRQQLDHDPFSVMPRAFVDRPRVLLNVRDLARVKLRAEATPWLRLSLDRLRRTVAEQEPLPDEMPLDPVDRKVNNAFVYYAERNALLALLTGEPGPRDHALRLMRTLARGYPRLPADSPGGPATGSNLSESRYILGIARAFDMLASLDIEEADEAACRELLAACYPVLDAMPHHACGNHTTWGMVGRVAVASALGDAQGLHDALYGLFRNGHWRYGFVHQLRHDFLADGFHWERTFGYHNYTLMAVTEILMMLANLGVDLWHRPLPTLLESDGIDLHRDYGPAGEKTIQAAYDANLYGAFGNGDLPLLHDSGLAHLRGLAIWGLAYPAAYDAYGEPRYAWLLRQMETAAPDAQREHPGLPMWLQTSHGDVDFVRTAIESTPDGAFSLASDRTIALTGRHEAGSTLFPSMGMAVLRSDPMDPAAPGVHVFWGPHSAGHQSPAALHLDLHAGGRLWTASPTSGGYGDPTHLTWYRATIAHNTVTVDGRPMFPYDFDTESIWEADQWRGRTSDGEMLLFQPDGGAGDARFAALRAFNERVYPGVALDRTIVLARDYAVDLFRVRSDDEHAYDWAMHLHGELDADATLEPASLGDARGYRHIEDARRLADIDAASGAELAWRSASGATLSLQLFAPSRTQLIFGRDPQPQSGKLLGVSEPVERALALIARARGSHVAFLALWRFAQDGDGPRIAAWRGEPHEAIEVVVARAKGQAARWRLPIQRMPVLRG